MNTNYLYEYINLFERVLSVAYKTGYSLGALEKSISNSRFFREIECNDIYAPIIIENDLIKEVFPELNVDLLEIPTYSQTMWSAGAYMRLQNETKYPFELIFLYLPIKKMYELYPLYHEMDFSHVVKLFYELYSSESALSLLLKKYKFSIKDLNKVTGIPSDTLSSFKQRKRDIKKTNVEIALKLSRFFHVRIETIAESKIL